MKKFLLLLGFLALFSPLKVLAASDTVDDQANLLSSEERTDLSKQADAINKEIKGEVFIVTTDSNTEKPRKFANEQLMSRVGKNNNGALLLLDMNQRKIYLSTSGNMIDYVTDKRRDKLLDDVTAAMKDGNYYQATLNYLTNAKEFVDAGVPGGSYRKDEKTGKITYYKSITPVEMAISLVAALAAAVGFFLFVRLRYQLKTGNYHYPYRQNAQLDLTERQDQLINSFVTTRRIPKPSNNNSGGGGGSTTNSSGGGTFGGGGRSF
ncbi:TPM domain-containing protein [Candidatus Enterococcus murrayae]|uniref:TPM domain-containing protein n=1 Tax=Candidatus Enterococcus murrayae TaxID=2815321 RepID=A0ABS3HDQ5_9ENTE|nr:TPM domain-containing protein [Enterococcus sp. MJM16]MBO0451050.1 TPM domain-containing protein [Enterococcus sp. MJM16]